MPKCCWVSSRPVRSEFDEAEKHFVRAVALEPRNYQAHAYLGSTYLQEKRWSDAAGVLPEGPGIESRQRDG